MLRRDHYIYLFASIRTHCTRSNQGTRPNPDGGAAVRAVRHSQFLRCPFSERTWHVIPEGGVVGTDRRRTSVKGFRRRGWRSPARPGSSTPAATAGVSHSPGPATEGIRGVEGRRRRRGDVRQQWSVSASYVSLQGLTLRDRTLAVMSKERTDSKKQQVGASSSTITIRILPLQRGGSNWYMRQQHDGSPLLRTGQRASMGEASS